MTDVLPERPARCARAELAARIRVLKDGFGYILHPDPLAPDDDRVRHYRSFVEEGPNAGRCL